MRRSSSQSEDYKVVFKLKEGQSGFSSLNPIRLAGALKEELGDILSARILADGKLLVFCKSAAQLNRTLSLEAI